MNRLTVPVLVLALVAALGASGLRTEPVEATSVASTVCDGNASAIACEAQDAIVVADWLLEFAVDYVVGKVLDAFIEAMAAPTGDYGYDQSLPEGVHGCSGLVPCGPAFIKGIPPTVFDPRN